MKIALGQINTTVGDFSGNASRIIDFSQRARSAGADLIIFPELSVCGYPARDMVERPAFVQRNRIMVSKIAEATRGIAVICGYVTPAGAETGKAVMNSAALLRDGKIEFQQSKMLLPTYDVFDEQRNFAAATEQSLMTFAGRKVALTICEDAWNDKTFWPHRLYSVDPVEELVKDGAEIIFNISASPFQLGKPQVREEMLAAIARRSNMPVVLVNQVGGNDSVVFDGTSMVVNPQGEVVVRGKSFEEDLVYYDTVTGKGELRPLLSERPAAAYGALVLGTRDYLYKCGFKTAVLGLSGGIDSALVACIAVDALGAENVLGIGMPSQYSSQGSIDDARALAQNLGMRFQLVPIQETFDAMRAATRDLFSGHKEDVTEENMQARVRGSILMAAANKFNSLVLTTSNKSEMAVGYSTLYGDMAGALAVIADVPKTFVYDLARWVNRERVRIPTESINKPPSAELRPGQEDTDSLPPYSVLDCILEDYVEDLKTPKAIAQERGYDMELVARVVKMIERTEYKRQQAPPGLKITEKAFGVGRRFPIAAKYEI